MSATTKTTTKTSGPEIQAASERQEIAVFQPPRLPYHPAIKDRFGIEPSGWKTLVEAVYPSAKTIDSVVLALSYCKARNLDPFKRVVHIVPMWDAKANGGKGGYVDTIWPGIAELRTTAFRTGTYAGCDETEFGPTIEKTFTGRVKVGRDEWKERAITVKFPEWCRITVYRQLGDHRCKFVGPKVLWLESYATIGKSELPNEMWQERAVGQIEKCAEAASLRRAFPEELGNEYAADEMAGRRIVGDDHEVSRAPTADEAPPSAAQVRAAQGKPQQQAAADVVDVESEEVQEEGLPLEDTERQDGAQPDGFTAAERAWLNDVAGAFSGCEDFVTLGEKQKQVMQPFKKKVSAAAWAKAQFLAEDAFKRLQKQDSAQ